MDAELGLYRTADNRVSRAPRAGVVAKAQHVRHGGQLVQQRNVVQIEDTAAVGERGAEFVRRGIVGREHDVAAARPDLPAEDEFGNRAAIESKAEISENAEDVRVWQRFDGEIFAEA